MSQSYDSIKIRPVLDGRWHRMTADGHGFYERIAFSIANAGRIPIDVSGLMMRIVFPGKPEEYPLEFPQGTSTLMPEVPLIFDLDLLPQEMTPAIEAVIILLKKNNGKELARADIQFITQ
jgi:hypothetical protein